MTEEVKVKHQLVIDMFRRGYSKDDIEEATGYQMPTINRILSGAGLTTKRRVSDYADTIKEMNSKGCTITEIAKETGFTACNIRLWMRQVGLYTPKFVKKMDVVAVEEKYEKAIKAKQRPLARPYTDRGKKYIDVTQMYAGG